MANKEARSNTLVHDTICLTLITLIAGIILGGVYTITKKPIEVQEAKTKAEAYAAVYAGAEFEEDKDLTTKLTAYNEELAAGKVTKGEQTLSDVTVSEVLKAKVDGQDAGYVATCYAKGYGGNVTLALGIDQDGKIKGIQVTDASNETPGLGQNSTNKDWNSQYVGMDTSKEVTVVKDGTGSTDNGSINAISGATITSKAVTRAVNGTLNFIASVSK